jgi:caffeoyl-CoA O-methyltransferase
VETVERLEGAFDFVFIDADKPNYVNYYEAVLPRLSERGLIAADNTLWSGRVLDDSDDSEGTVAIRAFNEHVRGDDRVVSVMLTVRDGVTLIRRA